MKHVDIDPYPFEKLAANPALPVILDCETAGHTEDTHFVVYFSWAAEDLVPGAGPSTTTNGFNFFKAILDSPRPKIFHNITADYDFIRKTGLKVNGRGYCTLLQHTLIDEYHPTHALDDLVKKYFDRARPDYWQLEALKKNIPAHKKNLLVPQEMLHVYARNDARDTLDLWRLFSTKLTEMGMWPLYETMMDAELVWYQMELDGIEFDRDAAEESMSKIEPVMEILQDQIYVSFGEKFSITSSQQLGRVMAKHFQLKKKTKNGNWVTDKEVLKTFRYDPKMQMIIAYRKLAQCSSKLRRRVEEGSTRLFPEYKQTLVTGRSSCSGTPLHQIPKRAARISVEDVGVPALVNVCVTAYKSLRKVWTVSKGAHLVTFDYDQAEYRAAAHYSCSERLISRLASGGDFHAITAELVFGECTPVLRDITKFINFGLLYGMGVAGLERLIKDLTTESAASVLARYERNLPEMRQFQKDVMAVVQSRGYVVDVFGRRYRRLPTWFKELHETDDYALINYLCQGTVAGIKRLALARLGKIFDPALGRRSKIVLEIHDEIGFEIFPEDAELLADIHKVMTDLPMFSLPFTTSPAVGHNLLEVKEMEMSEAIEACRIAA